MLAKLGDRKLFFVLVSAFMCICIALLVLFPNGHSFFIINGMHHPLADTFFTWFTYIGDGATVGVIAFLLMLFYRVGAGVAMGVALAFCGLTVSFLKTFIFTDSQRPMLAFWDQKHMIHFVDGIYINIEHSFPSGHSLTVFCCFTLLALMRFGESWALQVLFALCAILAAYSRVYLAHHFVGDIFAGALTGVIYAFCAYWLYQQIKNKSWSSRPLISYLNKKSQ